MKLLTKTAVKCLIVVNNKKKLLGTLTDGDIRRGILNGVSIKSNIKNLYKKNPTVVEKGKFSLTEAKRILSYQKQILLPIINKDRIVLD